MNTYILASLLCVCAQTASAESFQLFSKGHWSVEFFDLAGVESCVAYVQSDEVYFSVDVTADEIVAWYIAPANNFGGVLQEGRVAVWIDDLGRWETPATALDESVRMSGIAIGFLTELMQGQRLYIDDNFDGQWDAWVSLNGSSAAIPALADCAEKLAGDWS